MRFEHSFTTPGEADAVFELLAQPAKVAPCLPGARLEAAPDRPVEPGDELAGRVDVRIGPMAMQFTSEVRVLELDRARRRTVLGVQASDERGNGSAEATIVLGAEQMNGSTAVHTDVDLTVRGRMATFGSATIERVSQRLLEQFASNLTDVVGRPAGAAGEAPGAEARAEDGREPRAGRVPAPSDALSATSLLGPSPAVAWPLLATGLAFLAGYLLGRGGRRPSWRAAFQRRS